MTGHKRLCHFLMPMADPFSTPINNFSTAKNVYRNERETMSKIFLLWVKENDIQLGI